MCEKFTIFLISSILDTPAQIFFSVARWRRKSPPADGRPESLLAQGRLSVLVGGLGRSDARFKPYFSLSGVTSTSGGIVETALIFVEGSVRCNHAGIVG